MTIEEFNEITESINHEIDSLYRQRKKEDYGEVFYIQIVTRLRTIVVESENNLEIFETFLKVYEECGPTYIPASEIISISHSYSINEYESPEEAKRYFYERKNIANNSNLPIITW